MEIPISLAAAIFDNYYYHGYNTERKTQGTRVDMHYMYSLSNIIITYIKIQITALCVFETKTRYNKTNAYLLYNGFYIT